MRWQKCHLLNHYHNFLWHLDLSLQGASWSSPSSDPPAQGGRYHTVKWKLQKKLKHLLSVYNNDNFDPITCSVSPRFACLHTALHSHLLAANPTRAPLCTRTSVRRQPPCSTSPRFRANALSTNLSVHLSMQAAKR